MDYKASCKRVIPRIIADSAMMLLGIVALVAIVKVKTWSSVQSDALANASFEEEWRSMIASGNTIGKVTAPIHVIEFADFECPSCARLYRTLADAQQRYGDSLALTFIHYPLAYHRSAMPAARASECAADQGRFGAMYAALFSFHDSLGVASAQWFARTAAIPDTVRFGSCMNGLDTMPRIRQGIELGKRIHLRGTPTVLINGWRCSSSSTPAGFDSIVRAIAARR